VRDVPQPAPRLHAVAEPLLDRVRDRDELLLVGARGQQKEVGEAGPVAHVEQHRVESFLVQGGLGRQAHGVFGRQR